MDGQQAMAAEAEAIGGAPVTTGRSYGRRLLAAIALDRSVFHEVAADPAALAQAGVTTLLGGLALTVGTAGLWPFDDEPLSAMSLGSGGIGALVGWVVPTAILWLVGVKLLRAEAPLGGLLRAVGLAAAPQLLYLGCAGARLVNGGSAFEWSVAVVAWLLSQAALFLAVQQIFGTGAVRTLLIFAIGGATTAVVGLALSPILPAALWQPLVL